jgi:Na+-transporting methylmalonyl-CoA/oxaloacetate decarboxylase gamma subunit
MSDATASNQRTISNQVTDLHNMAAKQFNQMNDGLHVVDNNVGNVKENVKLINSEVAKLAKDFAAFVKEDAKQKTLIRYEAKIGNIRDKLKDQFGQNDVVRKHTTGILQADDLDLVRKDTITTVTEELMMSAPGYWLAPCLVALAAWINNKSELAEKAVREAIKRNDEKTSLLFALICRRANRQSACLKWIQRYLANQDEERLDRNAVIILDAFASGLLGADSEGFVAKQLEEWMTRLSDKAGFKEQQTKQWSDAINVKKKSFTGSYKYLSKYSKTWPQLTQIMEVAELHATTFAYFENIFNQQSSGLALKEQLDEILSTLVTDFDDEELPLRQEYRLAELIIENGGDENRARQDMDVLKSTFETHKDFTQLLTDAAMKPETAHASVSTQKFAMAIMKEFIHDAYSDIVLKNQKAIPQTIEINVDNFNDKSAEGKDEKDIISRFEKMVEGERTSANKANRMTAFQQYCMWGGIAVGGLGIVMLLFKATFLGILAIIAGIGMVIYHFSKKKAFNENRESIKSKFDNKNKDGIETLRAIIAEIVDFRTLFIKKDSESKKVLDFIDQIKPSETLSQISEDSTLASALPEWNVEPPVIAVRRKSKTE